MQQSCPSPREQFTAALQGLADPAGRITNDAPGLQLAIALGASVYLLSEKKRVPRGKASQLSAFSRCLPAPWGRQQVPRSETSTVDAHISCCLLLLAVLMKSADKLLAKGLLIGLTPVRLEKRLYHLFTNSY